MGIELDDGVEMGPSFPAAFVYVIVGIQARVVVINVHYVGDFDRADLADVV